MRVATMNVVFGVHYMSKSKLCVSIELHFVLSVRVFACQMSKLAQKNYVKN